MWFKKDKAPKEPRERRPSKVPEGLWVKCESCRQILYNKELARNFKICPKCGYHFRLSAPERLRMLFDDEKYVELDGDLRSADPLKFRDTKRYRDRLKQYLETAGTSDAIVIGSGAMGGIPVIIGAMEFLFLGGSMGSVVGEKVTRGAERALRERRPFLIVSTSGGARMQEGILSLMQMAKISAALGRLSDAAIPFISVMADPTTGGVTASYAMLGDLNIAEPNALIGFAGPRVIEQTIRQTLPEGFQRSEFLLEHGMLDFIVDRQQMKDTLVRCLRLLWSGPVIGNRESGIGRPMTPPSFHVSRFTFHDPSMSAFPALQRLELLSQRGMKLGLAAIDALCERLGRPERSVPGVLVGGTNGKGSTAATLSAIVTACGLRAGLYTSPHLIHVTERIRVEDRDISARELDLALARVFAAADKAPLIAVTYFEAATAAAFLHFRDRRVDLAVLEVGLGGRFDATNVAPAVLSAVTSIGLDHMEELGPTLSRIAREKAGIFRAGRPAIARASGDALEVLRAEATRRESAWHDAGTELSVRVRDVSVEGTRFDLTTPQRDLSLATALPGSHQAWNTALAIRAAELLPEPALELTAETIAAGVAAVRWPGRLERFEVGGRPVLLDGCHNAEGAAALAGFLADAGLLGRCRLVFGAMADKDIEGIAGILFRAVRSVTLVAAPSPRAASAQELARRVPPLPGGVRAGGGVTQALETLFAESDGEPIIVAGSLYLVGEARAWLLAGQAPEGRT